MFTKIFHALDHIQATVVSRDQALAGDKNHFVNNLGGHCALKPLVRQVVDALMHISHADQ